MFHEKPKSEPSNATRDGVIEELAKPRMTKSARIAQLNLETVRIPSHPGTAMPGPVTKIIPSPRPSQLEKAQIANRARRPATRRSY